MMNKNQPQYGNWMPAKMILITCVVMCTSCLLAIFINITLVRIIFTVLTVVIGVFTVYITVAYWLFIRNDGEMQKKICQALVDTIQWDGKGQALDIGTGSGRVAVMVAKKYPESEVTGVDLWKGVWEYSLNLCDRNAEIEGVGDRMNFKMGGVEALPFEDDTFDMVTSNYVFHSVKVLNNDRLRLIRESLRVLKPGGVFAFQDMFNRQFYADTDKVIEELRSWGLKEVGMIDTIDLVHIPMALQINHMVGGSRILSGVK